MSTRPTAGRYGTRDARYERTALTRACSAACRRLNLDLVRLSYFPPPTKRRWTALGLDALGSVVAEGRGRWDEEAVAAMTARPGE